MTGVRGWFWAGAGLLLWTATGLSAAQTSPAVAAVPEATASAPSGPGCSAAPLPGVTLYLRGSLNSWAPVEDYAFRWLCDAYYLNVDAKGRQEFKVADADWSAATNFGEGPDGTLVLGGGNAARSLEGEHTLRLDVQGRTARLSVGPKRIPDPVRREPTDPIALGLRFDSRSAAHKQPFGAVPQRTRLRYAVQAPAGVQAMVLVVESRLLQGNQDRLQYTEIARVPMRERRSGGDLRTWQAHHRFNDKGVFGYWFEAQIGGERYVIQNNKDAVHWTRERGSGGMATVDFLPESTRNIRRFRQTVHDPGFRVPAWAQDAIYYQIFPDRFRNGDPSNDPVVGRDRYRSGGIEKHAHWTDKPYRPGSGDGSDALFNNDFFGGDLAGIISKLDVLETLGVNTLYLTPIFRAPSNHKYDTADYKTIDPAFGRQADFAHLAREARRRGMRILPDTSFNHVGSDSPYFDRYGNWPERGAFEGGQVDARSPFASWFRFDTSKTHPDEQYAFWGGPELPATDKNSAAFRRFIFGAPDSVTHHWLKLGAAGWRMDVAPWVPDDFWRAWRQAVKRRYPQALTLAETWFDASKYFVGDMFDSTMNYVFRNAVLDYAAGGKAEELVAQLEHLREAYPAQSLKALMNLISSHDVARALHVLGWHDQPPEAEEAQLAKARFRLATFIQMTQPGAPSVYYGDEVGLTGGEDPYNRGTYPWPDLGGRPDTVLQDDVRRLIALRHRLRILRQGAVEPLRALDAHVMVSTRTLGRQHAWVVTNNSAQPRSVSLRDARFAGLPGLRDAMDDTTLTPVAGHLTLTVPPHFGRVLLSEGR